MRVKVLSKQFDDAKENDNESGSPRALLSTVNGEYSFMNCKSVISDRYSCD